jgi:hypothetical protein
MTTPLRIALAACLRGGSSRKMSPSPFTATALAEAVLAFSTHTGPGGPDRLGVVVLALSGRRWSDLASGLPWESVAGASSGERLKLSSRAGLREIMATSDDDADGC